MWPRGWSRRQRRARCWWERRRRDVLNAVDLEGVPPLALKGKSKPVAAYRLVAVHEMVERVESPMVGREPVLRSLHDAFAEAVDERSCQLVTVLGGAGVGKSRLAREFVKGIDAAACCEVNASLTVKASHIGR